MNLEDQAEAVIIDSFGTEFEVIKGTCIQLSFCEERSGKNGQGIRPSLAIE